MSGRARAVLIGAVGLLAADEIGPGAQTLQLPTANRTLFESGGDERFFVGTVGKPWITGTFGCVRSDGWKFHEGVDIRALQRDARGEPVDPVLAAADGVVAYSSTKPSLSNYGNYLVLRHRIEELEVYTLYAHLRSIREGLKPGDRVRAGEGIATMGRTTNTREAISKDRAHVHFEIDLLINERFPAWHKRAFPDQRNDHGEWNGQNLLGLDPRLIFLEQHRKGTNFSLVGFIQSQTELCRVLVRGTRFPWLRRYPALVAGVPEGSPGVAGYEISLNYNGVPFRLIPRSSAEIPGKAKYRLLSVNEAEYRQNPCRRLVVKRGNQWELGRPGLNLLDLMTHE